MLSTRLVDIIEPHVPRLIQHLPERLRTNAGKRFSARLAQDQARRTVHHA